MNGPSLQLSLNPPRTLGNWGRRLLLKSSWVSNRVNDARWQFGLLREPRAVQGFKHVCHGALVAVVAVSVAWAKGGLADPLSDVTVRWEAPPDCPDRVALDQELRRDLEGSQAPSIRVHVDANVAQLDPDTWRVSIRTESNAGQSERAITAHSCSALVDATSLIIAMLIDPETAATHARPMGTSESAGPSSANAVNSANIAAAPTSNVPPAPPLASNLQSNPVARETKNQNPNVGFVWPVIPQTQKTSWPVSGLVAAWVAGDIGSLPKFTEALGGSLGLLYGPWRAEASLGYWLPKHKVWGQIPNPNAWGEFAKLAGSAELCVRAWAPSRFALSPCAGLELARLSGIGHEFPAQLPTAHRPVASAEAGALGILSLTDALALRFDLDVVLPLNRPRFGFYDPNGDENTVFQPAWLAARARLGVELHFP